MPLHEYIFSRSVMFWLSEPISSYSTLYSDRSTDSDNIPSPLGLELLYLGKIRDTFSNGTLASRPDFQILCNYKWDADAGGLEQSLQPILTNAMQLMRPTMTVSKNSFHKYSSCNSRQKLDACPVLCSVCVCSLSLWTCMYHRQYLFIA